MTTEIIKLLQRSKILLLSICMVSCKHDTAFDLINKKHSNFASVFISKDLVCLLFHFDPGGSGGNSYELFTCNAKSNSYELAKIRDINDVTPCVDSIINKYIYIHYNYDNEKKAYPDTLHVHDIFLGNWSSLQYSYIFFNQSNNCGNSLFRTVSFDSFILKIPNLFLYSGNKLVFQEHLNRIQFPYKRNCLEYIVMNGCTEEYTVLEPKQNLEVDIIKKEILKAVLLFHR